MDTGSTFRSVRPMRALIGALLAVAFVAGCRQLLVDPAPGAASLSVALDTGKLVAADLASAFDKADRIYVRVERPGSPPVEVIRDFNPEGDEVRVSITLNMDAEEEPATITIELRSGNEVLFSSVQQVVLVQGGNVPVEFDLTPIPSRVVIAGPEIHDLNAIGATVQLEAGVQFATGDPFPFGAITWSSSDQQVASVDAFGVVTANGIGTATIRASYGDLSDEVQVRVQQEVASVTVNPAQATILVGETIQLSAVARDSRGNTISGLPVAWSAQGGAATVDPSTGLVTAVEPGTATITATIGGVSGSATISVLPVAREPFDGEWTGEMAEVQCECWGYSIIVNINQNGSTASGRVTYDYWGGSLDEIPDDVGAAWSLSFRDAVIEDNTIRFVTPSELSTYFYLELSEDGSRLEGYASECFVDSCYYDYVVSLAKAGAGPAVSAAAPAQAVRGRED